MESFSEHYTQLEQVGRVKKLLQDIGSNTSSIKMAIDKIATSMSAKAISTLQPSIVQSSVVDSVSAPQASVVQPSVIKPIFSAQTLAEVEAKYAKMIAKDSKPAINSHVNQCHLNLKECAILPTENIAIKTSLRHSIKCSNYSNEYCTAHLSSAKA